MAYVLLVLYFAAFLSIPPLTDDAGLIAFLILNIFQAVLIQCPAVANASSVASPAFSPNLSPENNNFQEQQALLTEEIQGHQRLKAYAASSIQVKYNCIPF